MTRFLHSTYVSLHSFTGKMYVLHSLFSIRNVSCMLSGVYIDLLNVNFALSFDLCWVIHKNFFVICVIFDPDKKELFWKNQIEKCMIGQIWTFIYCKVYYILQPAHSVSFHGITNRGIWRQCLARYSDLT